MSANSGTSPLEAMTKVATSILNTNTDEAMRVFNPSMINIEQKKKKKTTK